MPLVSDIAMGFGQPGHGGQLGHGCRRTSRPRLTRRLVSCSARRRSRILLFQLAYGGLTPAGPDTVWPCRGLLDVDPKVADASAEAYSRPVAGDQGRPGGNGGGTFVRGLVMAGGDGQGRFCHLTSQNGIGDDREVSTATACAGLQNRWAALRVAGGFDSRPPPPAGQPSSGCPQRRIRTRLGRGRSCVTVALMTPSSPGRGARLSADRQTASSPALQPGADPLRAAR
jgi:hypothetical protein